MITSNSSSAVRSVHHNNVQSVPQKPSAAATLQAIRTNGYLNLRVVNEKYPTVIAVEERLAAISCCAGHCRANATEPHSNRQHFIRGLSGLASHVRQAHLENKSISNAQLLAKCTKRWFNESEELLILSGGDLDIPIEAVFTTPTHGRGYIEFDREETQQYVLLFPYF